MTEQETRTGSFANYKFSLTADQQSAAQLFLRALAISSPTLLDNKGWQMLHEITYADSWTEQPIYAPVLPDEDKAYFATLTTNAVTAAAALAGSELAA